MTSRRPQRDRGESWSQVLPRPLVIPGVMTLKTLADVRVLIVQHLPAEYRARRTWRHVATELAKAAAGADTADVSIALRMALVLEKVEHQIAELKGYRE